MQTIAEMPEYARRAERLLSDDERQDIIDCLAVSPAAGAIMQEIGVKKK